MAGTVSPLLSDLAVVLVAAAVITVVFNRFKQPVVLGYLLAGFIVGPHSGWFTTVSDVTTVTLIGELGVIFLLFALGLEFNLRKLKAVGPTALVSGTLQVAVMVWLGYVVGQAFGLTPLASVFLGAIVSISSTVIIVKVGAELGQKDEEWAQVVFGILIIEDILAVLVLTVLSAAAGAEALTVQAVGTLLGTFGLFVAATLVVGLVVVPRLIDMVAKSGVDEMLVVTAVALGFGLAILGGALGFSPALGAFVMGALVAESRAHETVADRIAPVRDVFTAIFFVTVGMLVDPARIAAHWPLILTVTALVIVGKVIAGSFATFVTGRSVSTSLRVGFGLAQIGEFSFIIAALALSSGVTDAPLYAVAVSAAAVTAFTTPTLMRVAPNVARGFGRFAPRPLVAYAQSYSTWTRRLQEVGRQDPERRILMAETGRAVLFAAVAIAVLAAGGASLGLVERLLADQAIVGPFARIVGALAVLLAAVPFLLLYVRAQNAASRAFASAAVPDALKAAPQGRVIGKVVRRTVALAGTVLTGAGVLAVATPLFPAGWLAAFVAVGVGVAAVLFFDALRRFQHEVDNTLTRVMRGPSAPAHGAVNAPSSLVAALGEHHAWGGSLREWVLPGGSPLPARLGELNLRGRTGVSVLAIRADDGDVMTPGSDHVLQPNDRVVVVGSPEQLAAAATILGVTHPEGAEAAP